jgi:hypothetical protein
MSQKVIEAARRGHLHMMKLTINSRFAFNDEGYVDHEDVINDQERQELLALLLSWSSRRLGALKGP